MWGCSNMQRQLHAYFPEDVKKNTLDKDKHQNLSSVIKGIQHVFSKQVFGSTDDVEVY